MRPGYYGNNVMWKVKAVRKKKYGYDANLGPMQGLLDHKASRQLLKQGLDWDWTGTGLELD